MNRFGIIRAFDSARNHPAWLGGLYVVLVGVACMVIAFCAYLRFTFPRASIDEVLFALNAPTGSLAFAHIEPVLIFGLTPLALLILLSLLAFRFLTGFRLLFYTIIIFSVPFSSLVTKPRVWICPSILKALSRKTRRPLFKRITEHRHHKTSISPARSETSFTSIWNLWKRHLRTRPRAEPLTEISYRN